MEFWKSLFVENFNMERVAIDLLDMIEEDKLFDYIQREFKENFMYGEIYDILKYRLAKEDLQPCIEELGYEFIDLEELNEEEKSKYY